MLENSDFISPYCIQDVPFTHCISSWVLPQLPILFFQLIPYRALHPETREALTKWGIIRHPLMQVKNAFRRLRAVSFKVVFVWVFFSQGKATCVKWILKRCFPAFSERPWIRQMETSSWKSHGGQGTGLHQRMTGCDMCRWVCAAAYEPCSLMCTMSTQRACVCLRVSALAHDKGTWLCTCSACSTVRQQIPLPSSNPQAVMDNITFYGKSQNEYKRTGCFSFLNFLLN